MSEAPLGAAVGGDRVRAAHIYVGRDARIRHRDGKGPSLLPEPAMPVRIAERARRGTSIKAGAAADAIAEPGRRRGYRDRTYRRHDLERDRDAGTAARGLGRRADRTAPGEPHEREIGR